jgi:hypothetical protein
MIDFWIFNKENIILAGLAGIAFGLGEWAVIFIRSKIKK